MKRMWLWTIHNWLLLMVTSQWFKQSKLENFKWNVSDTIYFWVIVTHCLYNSFRSLLKANTKRSYRTFSSKSFPIWSVVSTASVLFRHSWLINMSEYWILLLTLTLCVAGEEVDEPQVRQYSNAVRCYIGTTFNPTQGSFTQSTTTCPDYSSGCVKRTICKLCL